MRFLSPAAPHGRAISSTEGTVMFAFFGLGAQELVLLVFIALMMVIGPVVAVVLAMAMMRRYYHITAGAVGKP